MNSFEYGICRLSVVPIRKIPSDAAEMISQLLFGEHYQVLQFSGNEKWVEIRNEYDGYQGWIDRAQHESISKDFFQEICNTDYQICIDVIAELSLKKTTHRVSMGAVLPLLSHPIFQGEEGVNFMGNAKPVNQRLSRAALTKLSKTLLNTPYLWGGRSSFGIDCSGFTQLLYRLAGIKLPRDSSQQILKGERIELKEAKQGDLAFFNNEEGKMNHVGLILKKDQVIHASGKVRVDGIDEKGIYNNEQNRYTHHLFMVKKYLP